MEMNLIDRRTVHPAFRVRDRAVDRQRVLADRLRQIKVGDLMRDLMQRDVRMRVLLRVEMGVRMCPNVVRVRGVRLRCLMRVDVRGVVIV